jgi:hypothetical protein
MWPLRHLYLSYFQRDSGLINKEGQNVEETLSSTSALSFCHWFVSGTTIKSVI